MVSEAVSVAGGGSLGLVPDRISVPGSIVLDDLRFLDPVGTLSPDLGRMAPARNELWKSLDFRVFFGIGLIMGAAIELITVGPRSVESEGPATAASVVRVATALLDTM